MLARLCAFVVWAAVAATAVFWALRLGVRAPEAPAHTASVGNGAALRGDLSRLLGAMPAATEAPAEAAPELASRFKLLGIMAPKTAPAVQSQTHGVALIAVDGKPARAFSVGARLDESLVLQSVSLRTASIGSEMGAAAALKLELPPPTPAATGVLPLPGAAAAMPAPPAAPPNRTAAMQGRPMPVPPPPPQQQDGGAPTQ